MKIETLIVANKFTSQFGINNLHKFFKKKKKEKIENKIKIM
jgi:hypothetical protein